MICSPARDGGCDLSRGITASTAEHQLEFASPSKLAEFLEAQLGGRIHSGDTAKIQHHVDVVTVFALVYESTHASKQPVCGSKKDVALQLQYANVAAQGTKGQLIGTWAVRVTALVNTAQFVHHHIDPAVVDDEQDDSTDQPCGDARQGPHRAHGGKNHHDHQVVAPGTGV